MTTTDRLDAMRALRAESVPDAIIGSAFGISRQRVHMLLGARAPETRPKIPPTDAGAADRLPSALRAWRERRGLTQKEAAKLLTLQSVMTYSAWETGNRGCALPALVLRYIELLDKHAPPTK